MGDELERLRRALAEAEEARARLAFSLDNAPDAVFWMDREGTFSYVSDQACRVLGYTREELSKLHLWDIDPDFPRERWAVQWATTRESGGRTFESRHRKKDGTIFPVEVSTRHVVHPDFEHHVAFVRDISDRRRAAEERSKLAEQLVQAQKMEAVGRLAGGVAHDFNNMLAVMLGYTELLEVDLGPEHPSYADLQEMKVAAQRSRDLTQQLLAFSRKQVVEPRVLDLAVVAEGMKKTLARLIGEDIEVRLLCAEGTWPVLADPGQIHQVLMNLAVNARDAMPSGGKLTIETANVHLDDAYCREHLGFTPGRYVLLAVSDNGTGMSAETQRHLFEPFFTTKEPGKGTGLGLSTVYGVVKQNGGFINVYSELGQGTTFKIYLPAALDAKVADEVEAVAAPLVRGGRVLLVEDDEGVGRMAARMLDSLGYTVSVVRSPSAALATFEQSPGEFALVLTDVVMPEMNGAELRERLLHIRSDAKVLFMSGYTANVVVVHGMLQGGLRFLHKPFTLAELAAKVREAIEDA